MNDRQLATFWAWGHGKGGIEILFEVRWRELHLFTNPQRLGWD